MASILTNTNHIKLSATKPVTMGALGTRHLALLKRLKKLTLSLNTTFINNQYRGIIEYCQDFVRIFAIQTPEMNLYSAPFWIRAIYPKGLLWRVPTNSKEVFLTFDDGPVPEVTPLVLEILKKYNIKATFFCVGENVQKYPYMYDLLIKDGHATGNHTFHHAKAWKTDYHLYLSEVEQCSHLVKSRLFRPPHGQINRKIVRKLSENYRIIMWSALSGDYDKKLTGERCLKNAVKNTRPGAIIVFHDSIKARERMEYALPLYIEHCLKQGYSFGIPGLYDSGFRIADFGLQAL